jgi:endonuclease-8
VPEGDTVWRTARHLDRVLSGHALVTTDFRVPELATTDLTGRTVDTTVSRGKHLLTRIGDVTLHTHLKMEGAWHLYRDGTPWRRPAHEVRVVLGVDGWSAVGFALGVVELVARDAEETVVGHLGPDLLGPDWDLDRALANLRSDPERPIGEALLDQRNLAGIGNIYRNELCFLAGVQPTRPTGEVPALDRLVTRAKAILEANKERTEQSTTGDLRPGRRTWVHDQRRCRRCGSPVRRFELGPPGRTRTAYACPGCQT